MKHLPAILLVALLAILGLGAAAPTWSPANLTYWQTANTHIAAMEKAVNDATAAMGSGKGDDIATEPLQKAVDYFIATKPPAALAPMSTAGRYAATVCLFTLEYFSTVPAESTTNAFAAPMLLAMRSDCANAVQGAWLESARAVAAVGAWPPAK